MLHSNGTLFFARWVYDADRWSLLDRERRAPRHSARTAVVGLLPVYAHALPRRLGQREHARGEHVRSRSHVHHNVLTRSVHQVTAIRGLSPRRYSLIAGGCAPCAGMLAVSFLIRPERHAEVLADVGV